MSVSATICNAALSPLQRTLRLCAFATLIAIATLEFGVAVFMLANLRSAGNALFLLCTLALLLSSMISVRVTDGRALLVVQSAAAAALLALFLADNQAHAGPGITIEHSRYELTLTLAGLLFVTMLLGRLLRRGPAEQACRCG